MSSITVSVLAECPSMKQLHLQMEEMNMLLNASRQQFNDRLLLVQRHAEVAQQHARTLQLGQLSAQQRREPTRRLQCDLSISIILIDA